MPKCDLLKISDEELRAINDAPWDGSRRIESPFVDGDYLEVAERPDLTMGEAEALWDIPVWGPSSPGTRAAVGAAFGAIFSGWQLKGKDGRPIQAPGNPLAYRALEKRYFWWVLVRAIRVIDANPLA